MKIISKLPDYYDYAVGYQKDESLVLNRNVEISGDYTVNKSTTLDFNYRIHDRLSANIDSLIFCGVRYPVVTLKKRWYDGLFSRDSLETFILTEDMLLAPIDSGCVTYKKLLYKNYFSTDPLYWEYRSEWVNMLKYYEVPYIVGKTALVGRDGLQIFKPNKTMPNLKQLGFSKIMGAEQAYQTIENFMLQELDAPDMVQLSNSDKVVKAGFDLKQSFRHRRTV